VGRKRPGGVTRKARQLLSPKIDFVFKQLFGAEHNQDLLLSLLNAILQYPPEQQIQTLLLRNPELPKNWMDEKQLKLDLSARDQQGRMYDIEMQLQYHKSFQERMLYYWARNYGTQLRTGQDYKYLHPVINIVLADFVLFPEEPHYRSIFKWRNQTGQALSEHGQIYFLELPKVANETNENHLLEHWLLFLREADQMEKRTLKAWETPELVKAFEELEELGRDPEMKYIYEARHKYLTTELQLRADKYEEGLEQGLREGRAKGIEQGLREGREQGLEQGREQARQEMAKSMLQQGISVEQVATITGYTEDELLALKK
jgi:predicted transposase/invertase (TIGR01784 family)